jgi:ABC-type transporter Mla MlaB component
LVGSHDAAVRPSFFQSSLQSRPDGRASTLKKIDEIEAQMSMHWWKSKRGDAPAEAARPAGAAAGAVHAPVVPSAAANDAGVSAAGVPAADDPAPPALAPAPVPGASRRLPAGVGESITDSELFGGAFAATPTPSPAIEVEEFVHDPELEEAAIRFANGDDAGAEACLLEAIGETGLRSKHLETWMSLFDLYRATGQREPFERLALDFLARFDRSAPQWFSMPDMVSQMPVPEDRPVPQAAGWVCPAVLDEVSLATLQSFLAKVPSPWRMDWGQLTQVEAAAVPILRGLLDAWASQPVQLQFAGAGPVDHWLEQATPSGDRSVDPACWLLRMAWLRATNRDDDFELAALNYCVTYEVSPPAWENPRCDYRALSADGSGETLIGHSFHDTEDHRHGASEFLADEDGAPPPRLQSVELAGRIMGDASDAMDRLEARFEGADVMLISCTRLIRVDFPAAGSLLNWVDGHQTSGQQIQFSGVHRLVAVFFHVIGISQLARVISRTD